MSDTEERTLVLVKPDAFDHADEIENRFRRTGLTVACRRTVTPTPELIDAHYVDHIGRPYYPELREFMLSGQVRALIVTGYDAISRARKLSGPTNPEERVPGEIRYDFGGRGKTRNAVHTSDGPESSARERALWFPGQEA